MKFYFCETCGKRLTEHDIEGGDARNKKLKGVFCKECAIGVTTMESLPLSNQEAHQVLEAAEPQAAAPDRARRPERRGSSRQQRISKRNPTPPAGREDRSTLIRTSVVAAVVAMVTIGGLLALRGPGETTGAKRKGKRQSRKPEAKSTAKIEHSRTGPSAAPKTSPEAKGTAKLQEQTVTPLNPSGPPSLAPENKSEANTEPPSVDPRPDPSPNIQPESHSAAPKVDPETTSKGEQRPAPQTPDKNTEASKNAVKQERSDGKSKETKVSKQKTPAPLRMAEILKWIGEGAAPESVKEQLDARLTEAGTNAGEDVAAVRKMIDHAVAVEAALRKYLLEHKDKRVLIAMPGIGKRFFFLKGVSDEGALIKSGKGAKALGWHSFSLATLRKWLNAELAGRGGGDERLVAWLALRGDPVHAKTCLERLPKPIQERYRPVLKSRLETVREEAAREALAQFESLQDKRRWKEALALGKKLRAEYGDTRALRDLQPSMERRLGDLVGHSTGFKHIFYGDVKRLANGMVELTIEPKKQKEVLYNMTRYSHLVRFTELGNAELSFLGVMMRYQFFLGPSRFNYAYKCGVKCIHDGNVFTIPDHADLRKDGRHIFRFQAGYQGVHFQINNNDILKYSGAWPGGRIKFPWMKNELQSIKLVGRLDSDWLQEMKEVAKQRDSFNRGRWVVLKPRARRNPRPEAETAPHHGGDYTVTHQLREWHQEGPSWTVEKEEWVYPAPEEKIKGHMAVIRPAALISHSAEMQFEARIDEGDFAVWTDRIQRNDGGKWNFLVAGPEEMASGIFQFGGPSSRLAVGSFRGPNAPAADGRSLEAVARPDCRGKWVRYRLRLEKGELKLNAENGPVVTHKAGPYGLPNIATLSGSRIRLRNVRIRRLAP